MGFGDDVASRVGDAVLGGLVTVDGGRARCDRLRGIDHRRQNFVLDLEPAAAFFGGGLGLRDHSGDLLSDEADDIVEHASVVRVHPGFLVPRGGEQPVRYVFVAQHRMHAGNGERRALVDRDDFGVRMRRAQYLDVQHAFHRHVEGVALGAAHHLRSGRRRQAAAEGGAGCGSPRHCSCRRARPRSRDSQCSGRCCPSARRRDPAAAPGSATRRSGSCPRCRNRTESPARRGMPAASGACRRRARGLRWW